VSLSVENRSELVSVQKTFGIFGVTVSSVVLLGAATALILILPGVLPFTLPLLIGCLASFICATILLILAAAALHFGTKTERELRKQPDQKVVTSPVDKQEQINESNSEKITSLLNPIPVNPFCDDDNVLDQRRTPSPSSHNTPSPHTPASSPSPTISPEGSDSKPSPTKADETSSQTDKNLLKTPATGGKTPSDSLKSPSAFDDSPQRYDSQKILVPTNELGLEDGEKLPSPPNSPQQPMFNIGKTLTSVHSPNAPSPVPVSPLEMSPSTSENLPEASGNADGTQLPSIEDWVANFDPKRRKKKKHTNQCVYPGSISIASDGDRQDLCKKLSRKISNSNVFMLRNIPIATYKNSSATYNVDVVWKIQLQEKSAGDNETPAPFQQFTNQCKNIVNSGSLNSKIDNFCVILPPGIATEAELKADYKYIRKAYGNVDIAMGGKLITGDALRGG
jgi:hypothetical protein